MSISSEVQRTLVKSPPELWAALSDPTSLAHHLGGLGEIRITRSKPEEKVEWEAPCARGTVDIRPSGWGTKVTLSIVRDYPDLPPPTVSDERESTQSTLEPQLTEEPIQSEDQVREISEVAAMETELTEEPEQLVGRHSEGSVPNQTAEVVPEPESEVLAEPEEPESESALSTRASSDPDVEVSPSDAGVEESRSDASDVDAEESRSHVEAIDPRPPTEQEPDRQQRRGFFSRLFRRRGTQPSDRESPHTSDAASAEPGSQVRSEPQPNVPDSPASSLQTTADPHQDTSAPLRTRDHQPPSTDQPPSTHQAPSTDQAPSTNGLTSQEGQRLVGDGQPPSDPDELSSDQDHHSSREQDEADPPRVDGVDLAGEIALLQEQTTAMLTAVLDRLGAAHHRPFSRT